MASRRIHTIRERLERDRSGPLFATRLLRVVDDCVRLTASDSVPNATWNYCITRLELLERNLHRANGTVLSNISYRNLQGLIGEILEEFRKGNNERLVQTGYRAKRTISTRGAPRYCVSKEQLTFLLHCGFKIPRVSELLGVSVRTVKRRMREYNLKIQAEHSPLTVGALDDLIRTTITSNQRLGPNAVRARLFAQGHRVQRWRVRESMLRVDPGGAALRAAPAMQRRTYTVAGPNSIWHIDGNHKLIRWKMVIHGGIDGFSRMMVFLHASANDRKEAVLEHFLAATTLYGVPSRIRVDHGGENNDICDIMELIRVPGRGSAIRGRSVHNQRIERSWVDLWNGATNLYYDLFHFMEQRGSLDSDNIAQLWALHYVFLPRFNKELQLFRDQWNNHGLRTAHHETSLQLFVGGTLDLSNARLTAMQDMFASSVDNGAAAQSVFENQGWDGDYVIQVPEIPCPLDQEALSQLQQTVDPLAESDELGIDIYLTVMDFISEYSLNDQP